MSSCSARAEAGKPAPLLGDGQMPATHGARLKRCASPEGLPRPCGDCLVNEAATVVVLGVALRHAPVAERVVEGVRVALGGSGP